jgi:hypothetical protein
MEEQTMSDMYKDLEQRKLYEIEQFKQETQEEQINQHKQRDFLQGDDTGEMTEEKALQQVRLRVSKNMPKTLKSQVRSWAINNEQEKIQSGKAANGVRFKNVQSVKNRMQLLRNFLAMEPAEDVKERKMQAKHIGESVIKVREACDKYFEDRDENEPMTEQEKKDYELIKSIRESIGEDGAGISGDVDAILRKRKMNGVKDWMSLLPEDSQAKMAAGVPD